MNYLTNGGGIRGLMMSKVQNKKSWSKLFGHFCDNFNKFVPILALLCTQFQVKKSLYTEERRRYFH